MASLLRSARPYEAPGGAPTRRQDDAESTSPTRLVEPAESTSPFPFLFWWFLLPLAAVILCEALEIPQAVYSLLVG